MRNLVTVITILAFAINTVAMAAGAVVFCSHSDSVHIEFSVDHSCSEADFGAGFDSSANVSSPDECFDIVLQGDASAKMKTDTSLKISPRIAGELFCADFNCARIAARVCAEKLGRDLHLPKARLKFRRADIQKPMLI